MILETATLRVVFLSGLFVLTLGGKHSLHYLYTIQSRNSTDRMYEFSAVTLLDDRQIDSYSSTDGVRTPKQDWLKEMKESEWTAGADKLKYDGQYLNNILDIQMKTFRHDESDHHTLQWRIGCEVETDSGGSLSVLNCINEYGYDGQNLISYNWTSKRWSASVSQAKVLEEEWNAGPVDRRCEDCVEWLKNYLRYNTSDTKLTKPEVHAFAKKSTTNSGKLTLTCLATGFYPKDVRLDVRKFQTSLPEHLLTSSGVRPNGDGTYQLRKSVEIQEDEKADYDCYVNHVTLEKPIIIQWDKMCFDCQSSGSGAVGPVIGGVVGLLLIIGLIIFVLIKKGIIANPCSGNATPALQAPPNGNGPVMTNGAANGHAEEVSLVPNGNGPVMTNGAANGHAEEVPLVPNGNGHIHENGTPATA